MYIISSVLLSILTCYIGIKEMKAYDSISDKLRKIIYLYPILLVSVFLLIGDMLFSVFFGAITPLLISHFIIDIKEQELPDKSNLVILIFAILNLVAYFIKSGFNMDLMPILGSYILTGFLLFIIYLMIALITGGALGGGDIKLVGSLGMFFPMSLFINLLIYPVLLGSLIGIVMMIIKKSSKDTKFAFGPAIIIAFYLIGILQLHL